MKKTRLKLFASIMMALSFSGQAMDENTFISQLRASLSRSPLTATQKARHILNRMGYGGNPISTTHTLSALDTDEKIIGFVKTQLRNVNTIAPSPANDVFARTFKTDPKALCDAFKRAKEPMEAQVAFWCRDGLLTFDNIDTNTDIPKLFTSLSKEFGDLWAEANKNKADTSLQERASLARGKLIQVSAALFAAIENRQAARALLEEDRSFRNQLFDFWFNHFNVTQLKIGSKQNYQYIPVIENNMMGSFHSLLSATAHSPQMLLYLENNLSGRRRAQIVAYAITEANDRCRQNMPQRQACIRNVTRAVIRKYRNEIAVNENYARELIELHTFGEGPGRYYHQHAVEEAAKILSGWSVQWGERDEFRFNPEWHVGGDRALFVQPPLFIKSGGQDEGETLLNYLAYHPVTARNISKKLATRFVSENAIVTRSLVNQMTKTFLQTKGDLPSLYKVLLSSSEFWSSAAYESKAVRPFDRYVRAARSLGIKVDPSIGNYTDQVQRLMYVSQDIIRKSHKDGQIVFNCLPPTGYPDDSTHWLSVGSALSSLTTAFKVEDLVFNSRAFADSSGTYLTANNNFNAWRAQWYFFLDRGPAGLSINQIQGKSVADTLNKDFGFELLSGERASELYSGVQDQILVGKQYRLLPVRTQMTLYLGSERASRY